MIGHRNSESSEKVAQRVNQAREVQRERFLALGVTNIHTNAAATPALIEQIVNPDSQSQKLMVEAAEKFSLSARAYHRVLKVARTLADLSHSAKVTRPHIAEALSYRLNLALN